MALEGVLVNGASEMLKKLITVVGSETSLAWGVKGELKTLKETLEVIEAKTSDAERKQVNDAAVSLWLKRLKQVSYDADDVLDEYTYEAMRRSDKESKVKDFFSSSNHVAFRFKMAHKIKGVNKQFNQIATDMQRFQFETTSSTSGGYEQHNKLLTSSFFGDVSKFVGRKADKSKIVKMLMSSQSSSVNSNNIHEKISVISIVGMGGLGKTSLSQSIYNDVSVEKYFNKKMWVCISDYFDVVKILKNIMESATNSRCEDFSNLDVLVKKVREELEGNKYLLVLDDLWNEDSIEWDKLKSVLDFGSIGSKVIVTTRSQKVAPVVQGSTPPYNLNVLSEAERWCIIKNKAFSPGGASETPNMKIIGQQIAKKCGSLPLAANFLGCLMHKQSDERQWLSIRENKSLETLENGSGGIRPILKLSYDTLPSHLKQCFSYCCLFPKDWVFDRETLIRLWMAEGFIHPSNGGNHRNSLEDTGNDYFLSLLSSSFFQDVVKDSFVDITRFKMHDLVHDLAYVSFGVGFTKLPKNIKNWVELRRLMYEGNKWNQLIMPRGIEKLSRLEVLMTFIVRNEDDTCSYNSNSSSIKEVADLNSLRKLGIINLENVKGGKTEAKTAKLMDKQNIQNLDLRWNSKVKKVVVNNSAMVLEGLQPHPNLEILRIEGFPGLKTPKWMGSSSCLPNLVELRFYDCKSCTKLVGLGNLPCLRILDIQRMDSVKCLGDEFYYQQDEGDNKGSVSILFPSLTNLYIEMMENLEEWFTPPPPHNSFPCLEKVEIGSCDTLTSIPDLRLWTSSLTKLTIMNCKKLEKESTGDDDDDDYDSNNSMEE